MDHPIGLRHSVATGTWQVDALRGWEGWEIMGRAAVVAGIPAVTELVIRRQEGKPPEALTSSRLRSLPLADIAELSVHYEFTLDLENGTVSFPPEQQAASRRIAERNPGQHDSRATTTPEKVAKVWNAAYDAGLPPRAAVCDVVGIHARTADRYIKRAREMGLITAKRRGSRADWNLI